MQMQTEWSRMKLDKTLPKPLVAWVLLCSSLGAL